jgi:ElaB/YqjD/DUF883 family membrane-anchored ribosome-binding protein
MQNPRHTPTSGDTTSGATGSESSTIFQANEGEGATGMAGPAAQKFDEHRSAGAGGLDAAASRLHQKADSLPGGESVKGAAHATADALSSTADYVREKDVKGMLADVRKLVKNNPGPALLTAAVLGFLVARTLSRD